MDAKIAAVLEEAIHEAGDNIVAAIGALTHQVRRVADALRPVSLPSQAREARTDEVNFDPPVDDDVKTAIQVNAKAG